MKNLTWQNPEQLFVAQELINKVKSKCCGIKDKFNISLYFIPDILQYQEHYLILNVFQSIIVLDVGIELSPIYTYKKITKIMPKSDQSLKYTKKIALLYK